MNNCCDSIMFAQVCNSWYRPIWLVRLRKFENDEFKWDVVHGYNHCELKCNVLLYYISLKCKIQKNIIT